MSPTSWRPLPGKRAGTHLHVSLEPRLPHACLRLLGTPQVGAWMPYSQQSEARLLCAADVYFLFGPLAISDLCSFILSPVEEWPSQYFPLPVYKLSKPQSTFLGIIEGWDFRRAFVRWPHSPWDVPPCCILKLLIKKPSGIWMCFFLCLFFVLKEKTASASLSIAFGTS